MKSATLLTTLQMGLLFSKISEICIFAVLQITVIPIGYLCTNISYGVIVIYMIPDITMPFLSHAMRKPTWFANGSDTNQAVQAQMARGLKFCT